MTVTELQMLKYKHLLDNKSYYDIVFDLNPFILTINGIQFEKTQDNSFKPDKDATNKDAQLKAIDEAFKQMTFFDEAFKNPKKLISSEKINKTPPTIPVPHNLAYINGNDVVIPVKSLDSYINDTPPRTLKEMCDKLLKTETDVLKRWFNHHKMVSGKLEPVTIKTSMEEMCVGMDRIKSVNLYLRSTTDKTLHLFRYKNEEAEASAASPFRSKKSQRSRSKSAKKRRNLKSKSKSKSKKRSPKPRRR
jgi:hypothetical protein